MLDELERDQEVHLMCYTGICSFESCGCDAGYCTAPRGFRERYGVSPCMVGGAYREPDDVKWAEEHADEIKAAEEAYWRDRVEHGRCR